MGKGIRMNRPWRQYVQDYMGESYDRMVNAIAELSTEAALNGEEPNLGLGISISKVFLEVLAKGFAAGAWSHKHYPNDFVFEESCVQHT